MRQAATSSSSVYGWTRAPIYASGTQVWDLSDEVFDRMVQDRTPFWTTLTRGDDVFRVYFLNDRGGIYAIGYPVITWFGHLVNLAELVALTLVLYALLIAGATVFNALASHTPIERPGALARSALQLLPEALV